MRMAWARERSKRLRSMSIGMAMATATALIGAAARSQQLPQPMLGDVPVKVSDHVWAIMGFPNIGIVIGTRGVLVVDTGLGTRNGATVARVVAKLAPHKKLYLTTTHFHPEHAAGEAGFPAGAVLIRDQVQQRELEAHGKEIVDMFSSINPQIKELLADAKFRTPDITFDSEYTVDLGGGITARLLWLGEAHTDGDELIFVDPDKTLISGDVVQNKTVPNISGSHGTPASWIAVLDKVQPLGALHVLPDHSAVGDGSLVAEEKGFLTELQSRALALKSQGVSADSAGTMLAAEFKAKHPDWPMMDNVKAFVKRAYAE